MALENAFILCAGLGTRMGEIGKLLPKLLWPIFELPMLELQVRYARSLGCKRIFINSHHLHEQIVNFISEKKWSDVILIHEPTLLDVGGGICNIARRVELKNFDRLLILNGDQFYFFPKDELLQASLELGEASALLFGIQVDAMKGYNETIIENNKLIAISPPSGKTGPYLTYSGVGIVNLKKLKPMEGPSKFFETVAPYKSSPVIMKTPSVAEYWDFGTSERYFNSIFKMLNYSILKTNSSFMDFCNREKLFDEKQIFSEQNAYGQQRFKNTIKFGQGEILNYEGFKSIFLGDEGGVSVEGSGIFYQGIYDPLP